MAVKLAGFPEGFYRNQMARNFLVVSASLHIVFPLLTYIYYFERLCYVPLNIGLNDREKFKFHWTIRKIERRKIKFI